MLYNAHMNAEIHTVKDWEARTGLKGRALAKYLGMPEATLRDAKDHSRPVGITDSEWFTVRAKKRNLDG